MVDTDKFVTKDDLKEFATKADLKAGLAELKAEMLQWNMIIASVIIAAMGLMFTASGFFFRL